MQVLIETCILNTCYSMHDCSCAWIFQVQVLQYLIATFKWYFLGSYVFIGKSQMSLCMMYEQLHYIRCYPEFLYWLTQSSFVTSLVYPYISCVYT